MGARALCLAMVRSGRSQSPTLAVGAVLINAAGEVIG